MFTGWRRPWPSRRPTLPARRTRSRDGRRAAALVVGIFLGMAIAKS